MARATGRPLPSASEADAEEAPSGSEESDSEEESADAGEPEGEAPEEKPAAPARPAAPAFKLSTFLLTFMFLLGMLMVFDTGTRNAVAGYLSYLLGPLIGFGGHYVLLTMFLAGAVEMILTAVAYNFTTDWIKAARTQKWSQAFRKVQMEAMRSGKKDRLDALKSHQQQLTKLSSEMSMSQLKGMAVTWFLLIAIYTWVGLFIACAPNAAVAGGSAYHLPAGTPWDGVCASSAFVSFAGNHTNLTAKVWLFPLWFLVFSLYTIPASFVFRRYLKHYSLRRHEEKLNAQQLETGAAGGAA
jgi:uncharacterized membrane protein (DUF106 family)